MLTKLEVRNSQNALLELPFWGPTILGYRVEDVTGLDPVQSDHASTTYARLPGAQYQNQHRQTRNILITLDLKRYGTKTIEELRNDLYPFFSPGRPVSMKFFKSNGGVYNIAGRVESLNAPLFTKEPQAAISIICYDPDFIGPDEIELTVNASPTAAAVNLNVFGTEVSGFDFYYQVTASISGFRLEHLNEFGVVEELEVVRPFVNGNIIRASTKPRQKAITVQAGTVTTSILNAVTPESEWFSLQPGTNQFRLLTSAAAGVGRIRYYPRYGGL